MYRSVQSVKVECIRNKRLYLERFFLHYFPMYGKLAGQCKLPYREVHDSKLFLQRSNTCENIIKKVCPFTLSVGDVDRVYEMNLITDFEISVYIRSVYLEVCRKLGGEITSLRRRPKT